MMFARYCIVALMAVLCTHHAMAMRAFSRLRSGFKRVGVVTTQRSIPKIKFGRAGRMFARGVAAGVIGKTSSYLANKTEPLMEQKSAQQHVVPYEIPFAWLCPKLYWENKYRDLLEYCGTKDPEQKYQDEFQQVVTIFKEKGLLKGDSVIFLKTMGPKSIEVFKEYGWLLDGNAFIGGEQDHFVHAHETLLSDKYTPEERSARFGHELVHVAINQNPKMRYLLVKRKWEEVVCDVVSVFALQRADGASKLMQHTKSLWGRDVTSNNHPKLSTRIKYFNILDPWVKPIDNDDDDKMHDLIEAMSKCDMS